MNELLELAISNIEICLGSRPLYQNMFLTTPGLINGMLLLTGAKGSGKSSMVRALCRHVAELPNLAHTMVMDCKPLRGKVLFYLLYLHVNHLDFHKLVMFYIFTQITYINQTKLSKV